MSGRGLGVDWVPVAEEPSHGELLRNRWVRVYQAVIDPGSTTLDHRHHLDTVYLIVRGGVFRSDNSWRQRNVTRPGRSTGRLRTLGWLLRRLTVGWLAMPDGTLLWQPHGRHPLVHRVSAAAGNPAPIRMLGIELLTSDRPSRTMTAQPGVALEHRSAHSAAYRLTGSAPITVPGEAVLTVVHGSARAPAGELVPSGETRWIAGPGTLTPSGPLLAVLTLV